MQYLQVILDPCNKVILEYTLDDLMEKIGGEEFVNVRTGKHHCERL
jgi:hypothetical protein